MIISQPEVNNRKLGHELRQRGLPGKPSTSCSKMLRSIEILPQLLSPFFFFPKGWYNSFIAKYQHLCYSVIYTTLSFCSLRFKNLLLFIGGIVALQYCVSFWCTMKWTSYMYTYIPSLLDLPPQHWPPPHTTISWSWSWCWRWQLKLLEPARMKTQRGNLLCFMVLQF